MLFGCTRLTQDTCTLHQRKYPYVVLITIKALNIGADRSDPDETAPNCFAIPPVTGICIHCNLKRVMYDNRLTI